MTRQVALFAVAVIVLGVVVGTAEANPIDALNAYLSLDPSVRPPLSEQSFAKEPLSREQAEMAAAMLWAARSEQIRAERKDMMDRRVVYIKMGTDIFEMPFYYRVFGEPVEGKYSLYISLHGGGSTSAAANDQQWENQKNLYQLEEGIYLAPRAPADSWDMWHQPQVDLLLDCLIENMIVFENVDPNRIYLMGYSAGGDGVYQLAPRMADRFAAAAMMAGHPNDAEPYGLRNIGFTIQMGGQDSAYNRAKVAAEWKQWLAALQAADPDGYKHWVQIYPQYGHWMQGADRVALPWMAQFTRDPYPSRVVWKQDDVTHTRFYWLGTTPEEARRARMVIANYEGQEVHLERCAVRVLQLRLHDRMLDLDQPIRVTWGKEVLFEGIVARTIEAIASSLEERADPESVCFAELWLEI
ncbi:MAG TPA: alpha/beta hydrolase [Firmicutes bacterium]|nr:alpha/beta hydrolase [Bacillota bacterium]